MDALRIFQVLSHRKAVPFHQPSIRMAGGARCGDIRRIDGSQRIFLGPDAVSGMTTRTHRHVGIAEAVLFPVLAGEIFGVLIGGQVGIVLAHVGRVGVAARTELWDLGPRRTPEESLGWIHPTPCGWPVGPCASHSAAFGGCRRGWGHRHRGIHGGGIAPMAVCAGQPPMGMHVMGHEFRRRRRVSLPLFMAGHAAIRLLRRPRRRSNHHEPSTYDQLQCGLIHSA